MQLDRNVKIAATASSILGAIHAPTAIAEGAGWTYDITGFRYAETDDRITDSAFKLQATRTAESGNTLALGVGYDSLTGASAGGYVAPDGSGTPVLTPVEDGRLSASLNYAQPLNSDLTGSAGISYSREDDYLHRGINFGLSKELNNKNTTLNLGYALASDAVEGVVGNPVPLSLVGPGSPRLGEQDKTVNDIVLGITQVLSKTVIAQFNYSFSNASGYLNDPYKVVSIIDSRGVPLGYVNESRPSDRTGQALYGAINIRTPKGVLKPSYRYFTDDWGINSHTFDFKYSIELGNGNVVEPHFRYYAQTRADFYRGQYPINATIPRYISSDYRLDAFNAITIGLQYRWKGQSANQWRIGMEFYHQMPDSNPDQLPGQNDLNPGISALLIRFGLTF